MIKLKKSHSCEEGGAHLRFPFWHLLMNLKNPKNQNFEKMKKNCWKYHHFTHVHQKPQSYAVQFLRYGVRHIFVILKNTWKFYPFTHVHHKSRSYDVWFMRYKVQRTKFIVILGNFLPSDPPNNPKNQNFEKILKNPGNIIILHLCTTNDDHMIRLWQMRHAVACTCLCTRLKH